MTLLSDLYGQSAVLENDFNANTFLYAVTDDTPVVKTRAEVLTLLSGQAGADFSMNTHKIVGVVDPTAAQEAATKKYVDDNAGGGGDPSTAIHAAATKATPVDADELGLVDSAASWVLKKLTWANLKATLKTYFDTLYAALAHKTRHQNGGADEINVGGLSGLLADDQHVLDAEVQAVSINNVSEDTTPQLGGELDAGAHSIGFTQQSTTGDGTTTIDWKLGNKFKFTFGAQNDIFTFTAPTKPCNLLLLIIQDATGGRTITWPATVKWPGGTEPTLSTGAGAKDVVALYYDGTYYFTQATLNFS